MEEKESKLNWTNQVVCPISRIGLRIVRRAEQLLKRDIIQ